MAETQRTMQSGNGESVEVRRPEEPACNVGWQPGDDSRAALDALRSRSAYLSQYDTLAAAGVGVWDASWPKVELSLFEALAQGRVTLNRFARDPSSLDLKTGQRSVVPRMTAAYDILSENYKAPSHRRVSRYRALGLAASEVTPIVEKTLHAAILSYTSLLRVPFRDYLAQSLRVETALRLAADCPADVQAQAQRVADFFSDANLQSLRDVQGLQQAARRFNIPEDHIVLLRSVHALLNPFSEIG